MKKIYCIGELLIDWISTDINQTIASSTHFIKKAGGAPANVCIAASRLGGKTSFAGKVGKDPFGRFLQQILIDNQVDTQDLILCDTPTTFAFVSLQDNGERDFTFQRGADAELTIAELNLPLESVIYHFGSATGFLPGNLCTTYYETLKVAIDNNIYISFDPNFRDALWQPEEIEQFNQHCEKYIAVSDFIKLSEEEALLISQKNNLPDALASFNCKENAIICVTLGKLGTLLYYKKKETIIPSISVQTIDTTGAGDAFVGAMLYQIAKENPMDETTIVQYIHFANKVAALSTTKMGAIEALPYLNELD